MTRAVRVLLLSASAGAVTGLAESLPLRLAGMARVPVHLTPHYVWVLPVLYAALFSAVGGGLLLLARRLPAAARRETLVGVTAGLGTLCVLLLAEAMHDAAALLLAAGVGVQAARWSYRPLVSRATRILPWAGVAVLGLGAAQGLTLDRGARETERQALRELPRPRPELPNILLLILDTVRAWELGAYGAEGDPTPALDSLASRGVLFRHAVAPAPWTLPSHASLFTGRWPHELNAGWDAGLDATHPTLAQALSGGGYATAAFVANLLNASRYSGLGRGFARYEDFVLTWRSALFTSSLVRAVTFNPVLRRLAANHELLTRKDAPSVNRAFLDWVDGPGLGSGRPFFAFLNYFDAHEPFFPPDTVASSREWNRFVHRGGVMLGENAWVADKWLLSPEQVAIHAAAYRQAVEEVDRAVGELMGELRRRGLLRNTVVIVTSDHGEQMGENGLFEHNNSLYPAALRVPLIVLWEGRIPAGAEVQDPVSLRDLPATLLELAGAPEGLLPGESMAPLWSEAGPHPPREVLAHLTRGWVDQPGTPIELGDGGEMWSRVAGLVQYILNPDGSEELYDWTVDPFAERDRAGDPAFGRWRDALREGIPPRAPAQVSGVRP